MRIVVVGATGTIGRELVKALRPDHEIVEVAHRHGPLRVDLGNKPSIEGLFDEVGPCDAVVCAAGVARFGPLAELGDADFNASLANKLMGQVNLVRVGRRYLREGGSFTLTSGVLAREPVEGSAAISMVNAGLEGFVRAAALELEGGQRINVVSPPWASETLAALGRDPAGGLPAAQFVPAYRASIEGSRTGEVLDVRRFL